MALLVNMKRASRMADEFALYMTDRMATEKMPLVDGLTAMAIAVGNIIETTAETNAPLDARQMAEKFKEAIDEYIEEGRKNHKKQKGIDG